MPTISLIRNEHGSLRPLRQPANLGDLARAKDDQRLADMANRLETTVENFIAETVTLGNSQADLNSSPNVTVTSQPDRTASNYDEMTEVRHLEMDPRSGKPESFERRSSGTTAWHLSGLAGVFDSWSGTDRDAPSRETATYKAGPLLAINTTERYQHPKKPDRVRQTDSSLIETEPGAFLFSYRHHDNSGLKSISGGFRGRGTNPENTKD